MTKDPLSSVSLGLALPLPIDLDIIKGATTTPAGLETTHLPMIIGQEATLVRQVLPILVDLGDIGTTQVGP